MDGRDKPGHDDAAGSRFMREKELRIALVCFGGISLAVYMHGISKEILKLVRASCELHAIADRARRAKAAFLDDADPEKREYDTESIYFELLREIGRKIELRVVVDIIAGASAGGINGTLLARALSHDLPFGPMRNLWLDNADVSVLLAPEAKAGSWSKWFLKPVIWGASAGMLRIRDAEVRRKVSLFVRSRWFKPPLDGRMMARLMYDAITAMGTPKHPGASLLPSGHSLDLFVTLTDYHGHHRLVQIHDPPLIHELEHHHVLHFAYRRKSSGEVDSDFTLDNAPGLAFAARATSSFPGAFPPAHIAEVEDVAAERADSWPRRSEFLAHNFQRHLRADIDPATCSFIDGAVLNNRPFREAIAAIHGRPAYRQVDRRLVYIEPDPAPAAVAAHRRVPGFFATLRGAISDIPRTQPVTDELSWVTEFNDQIRRVRDIVESARPHISQLVMKLITVPLDKPIGTDQIRTWREQVNIEVARDAGFAYEGYVRLKLATVRAFVAQLIVQLRGQPAQSPLARVVGEIIDVWAKRKGLVYEAMDHAAARQRSLEDLPRWAKFLFAFSDRAAPQIAIDDLPRWAKFLLAFDLGYRERRLHFLIEGQNRLYQLLDEARFEGLNPLVVDRLKREFYARLDALRRRANATFYSAKTCEQVARIFPETPSAGEIKSLDLFAGRFVDRHEADLDQLMDQLAAEIDLHTSTRDLDELLATMSPDAWHPDARREVLVNYLGFPFWDVLSFPVISAREMGELNEILVDRISPQDARSLTGFDGASSLKGVGFGHFAGFLSRAYRENDYLLGRLHALDRLIDIVCDSAGVDPVRDGIDVIGLKKRGFTKILDVEAPHLPNSNGLIAKLRDCIAAMGGEPEPVSVLADPEMAHF
ncbi:MAG: patatin-like protein [Xanthobacteraceae bacterium]